MGTKVGSRAPEKRAEYQYIDVANGLFYTCVMSHVMAVLHAQPLGNKSRSLQGPKCPRHARYVAIGSRGRCRSFCRPSAGPSRGHHGRPPICQSRLELRGVKNDGTIYHIARECDKDSTYIMHLFIIIAFKSSVALVRTLLIAAVEAQCKFVVKHQNLTP